MESWKEIISNTGFIPVVKIEDSNKAVELANALLASGLKIIEITFRTKEAKNSIEKIRLKCPDILVGAGTILTIEQLDDAQKAGAQFIVTPGLNEKIVLEAKKRNLPIIPGVSSASEIEKAMELDFEVLKFFPALSMGGTSTLKSFYGPYSKIKFIPTGGIDINNMNNFLSLPNVLAVGGSWIVDSSDISDSNWSLIESKVQEMFKIMHGIEFNHIGIFGDDYEKITKDFENLFDINRIEHTRSNFISSQFEIMKEKRNTSSNLHIALGTNNINRAMSYYKNRGYDFDEETSVFDQKSNLKAIYFKERVGGLSVHLMQK